MDKSRTIRISSEKVNKLDSLLANFCEQANIVWAIFVTSSGQLLVQKGFVRSFDVLAISALACGVFNSTMELARIVGEKHFNQFLQEGKKFSVYYIGVQEEYLLVSLFDDRTLAGVVKVASKDFSIGAESVLRNGK
jgi:predicted regulator of Ras-like GTPase activity (Roadblock/LC7/MglB family)